jgi:hypothetical protein
MQTLFARTAILILVLAGLGHAGAAERLVLTQADIQKRAMVDPFSFEKAMQAKTADLATRIHALRADTGADPVLREKLLTDASRALGGRARTPAAEAALRALAGEAPIVFVPLDDAEHAGQVVPAFDPGAMARFALGRWVRHEARDATLSAFAAGAASLAAGFDADGEARLIAAGIEDAVELVAKAGDAPLLRRNREALKATLAAGYPIEDAVAAAAVALEDAALAQHLYAHGDPARTVQHLAALTQALPSGAAVDLLARIDHPELASAALLALGRLAATEPRARERLLAKLADPRDGGSAAAALAAQHDPALAPTLAAAARSAPQALAAKRAALTLFLDASPAARSALASLTDDPRVGRDARHWLAALPPAAPL